MADVKVEGQYGFPQQPTPVAAPAANAASEKPHYVQKPPTWVIVIRGIQIFLSVVILGIAAYLMNGKVLDENAFALVCALFTWIVVGYTLITEKVTSANEAYNIWAVMALDLLMAILWLASMASNAALRGKFNTRVRVSDCYDTGAAFNSSYCTVYRRLLAKRGNEGAIASDTGLNLIATIAGLSALVWILFIVTLVYHGHTFRMWHAANKGATLQPAAPAPVAAPAQAYAQPAPVQYQQGAPVPVQQTAPAPAYSAQSYPQQTGVPAQFAPSPVGTPAPQQPFQAPQQQYGYPNPAQQQYVQPTQSPAPGQPYYPPTQ